MVKLQSTTGCTSCSHAGIIYKVDKKGIFIVPPEAVGDLVKFHKFIVVVDKAEDKSINTTVKVKDVVAVDELDELDELDEKLTPKETVKEKK